MSARCFGLLRGMLGSGGATEDNGARRRRGDEAKGPASSRRAAEPAVEGSFRVSTARLLRYLVEEEGFRSESRAELYCRWVFGDTSLAGKSVLDIGSGKGWLSLYAAASGAASVVALEPESDGSTSGDIDRMIRAGETLGLACIEPRRDTIQEYRTDRRFDVIVLRASVNHLDEEACIELRRSEEARNRYRAVFSKLRSLMPSGGHLILTDSSPYNLFPTLGLRNPFARRIEWHKHQPPQAWVRLLRESGFADPVVTWKMPARLAPLGRLAANPAVAFLIWSRFRIRMSAA